jgi:hypothetical protein
MQNLQIPGRFWPKISRAADQGRRVRLTKPSQLRRAFLSSIQRYQTSSNVSSQKIQKTAMPGNLANFGKRYQLGFTSLSKIIAQGRNQAKIVARGSTQAINIARGRNQAKNRHPKHFDKKLGCHKLIYIAQGSTQLKYIAQGRTRLNTIAQGCNQLKIIAQGLIGQWRRKNLRSEVGGPISPETDTAARVPRK